jgi:hypothetical protein
MSDGKRVWSAAVMRLATRSIDGRIVDSVAVQMNGLGFLGALRWMPPADGGMINPFQSVDIGVITSMRVDSHGTVWVGGELVAAMLADRDGDAWVRAQSLEGLPVSVGTRCDSTPKRVDGAVMMRNARIAEAVICRDISIPPWPGLDGLSVTREADWVARL